MLPRLSGSIARGNLLTRFQCLKSRMFVLRFIRPQAPRWASTAAAAAKPITPKMKYPERLLIYHAGTGRTVFIGCLKVTTIFIFAFFSLVAAPAHLQSPGSPLVTAVTTFLIGAIPLAFITTTTAPFVTYVHLRLPLFARQSKELLARYARGLPETAELDITTMSLIGRPKRTRMKVADLKAVKSNFLNITNFVRIPNPKDKLRPWWMGKQAKNFSIRDGSGKCKEAWVWDLAGEKIEKRGGKAVKAAQDGAKTL